MFSHQSLAYLHVSVDRSFVVAIPYIIGNPNEVIFDIILITPFTEKPAEHIRLNEISHFLRGFLV